VGIFPAEKEQKLMKTILIPLCDDVTHRDFTRLHRSLLQRSRVSAS
jgi:hypothetical protein